MNNLSRRDFLKLPAIITLVTLFGFITNIITILLGQEFGRIGPFKDFLEELNTIDPIIKSKAYRTIADIIAVSPRLKADGIYIAVSRYYSQQLVAPYAGESTLEIARQAFENQGTLITYISFIFKDGFENGSKSGKLINLSFNTGHFNGPNFNNLLEILIVDFDTKGLPNSSVRISIQKSTSDTQETSTTTNAKYLSNIQTDSEIILDEYRVRYNDVNGERTTTYSDLRDLTREEFKQITDYVFNKFTP